MLTTKKIAKIASIILLVVGAIALIPLEQRLTGYIILLIGALTLLGTTKEYARDIALVYLSIGILGITPIDTRITIPHMLTMGGALALAVGIPFFGNALYV